VEADPASGYALHDLAVSQLKMGEALLHVDPEQSIGLQEQALQSVDSLLESSPQEFRYLRLRARCLTRQAMAVAVDGDLLRASGLVRDALDMLTALQVQHPANRELDPDLDLALQVLGDALASLGNTDEALTAYAEAARRAEAASSAVPSDLLALWRCADAFERLGDFHAGLAAATDRQIHWAEAQAWYALSLERWREWNRWGASSTFNEVREARVLEARLASDQAVAALRASEQQNR
jgi:tetratricopeptide (TPR) repeat protein